jgi:hypothetical protein
MSEEKSWITREIRCTYLVDGIKWNFFRAEFAWKTMKHEIYERAFLMAMPTAAAAVVASCISYRDIRDGSYSAKNANSPASEAELR